jgi:hypothetical protein
MVEAKFLLQMLLRLFAGSLPLLPAALFTYRQAPANIPERLANLHLPSQFIPVSPY